MDWIFSHAQEIAAMETEQSNNESKLKDGPGSESCDAITLFSSSSQTTS